MTTPTRAAAQRRSDAIASFRQELAQLESEGVLQLAAEQKAAIAAHHQQLLAGFAASFDIDRNAEARQLSWGMKIASFLGALALAASVFFLFYQFWGYFAESAQVAILIGAALGSLALTGWVQQRDASGYFTKLAALVAFACFALNIAMLGQIFNITPSDKALLPWAALALLLAYACDLRLLLAAGLLCLIAFVAARAGTWGGGYWLHFGERPENFIPFALVLFALPQWIKHQRREDFPAIYRVFGLLSLLLPTLVLANWGQSSYLPWPVTLIEGGYQVFGFAASAAAIWLGLKRHWPDTVNTGLSFFVIFLYTKFFDWWWQAMPKFLFFLILGLAAVLCLLVLKRLRRALAADTGEAA